MTPNCLLTEYSTRLSLFVKKIKADSHRCESAYKLESYKKIKLFSTYKILSFLLPMYSSSKNRLSLDLRHLEQE